MRPLPILTVGALVLALAAPAMAGPDGKRGGYDRSEPMARAEMMAKTEQRFATIDTNADGTINAAEMTAHREAMKAARAEKRAAMSEADKARLIADFERWSGMSTAEMVQRAGTRQLPSNPEYADWLVLAGRSDLL